MFMTSEAYRKNMTGKTSKALERKINDILQLPSQDRTDEQNVQLLFADVIKQYDGIKSSKNITEEIEDHYYSIKNKELTAEHREIFNLTIEERLMDYQNPCKPGKKLLKEKGEVIDRFCKVLNIKKKVRFHEQIKKNEIYAEDIVGSDWYRYVLEYKSLLSEIFRYEIGKDFEDNPLKYFKTFSLKVMGISCELIQPKGCYLPDFEDLWKQHKREDIYRKHYGGTPKADSKKRIHSDDWITKKIAKGEKLTTAEQKLRALRKHVAIHRQQPQYKRYLSNIEDSPLYDLIKNREFEKNKHNGGTSR